MIKRLRVNCIECVEIPVTGEEKCEENADFHVFK